MPQDGTASGCHYWAFISYHRSDAKWARWLHHAIETYKVPARLVRHLTPAGHPAPGRFHPVFRDRDELPASSDIGAAIEQALRQSQYLIVICSPGAARSQWVDREIAYFAGLGRSDRVLAMIVGGEPNAGDETECFPPHLRRFEPTAADTRPDGDSKHNAKLRLLAGMLGVSFDALHQRDAHRRMRRLRLAAVVAMLLVVTFAVLAGYAQIQRGRAEAERDRKIAALADLSRENYRNVIALAASKLDAAFPEEAEALLWDTAPEHRSWEWGRLMARARRDDISFDTNFTSVKCLSFDANARFLLACDRDAFGHADGGAVFDLRTAERVLMMDGRLRFVPGTGRLFVRRGLVGTVLDLPSGHPVVAMADLVESDPAISFSADGAYALTQHADGALRVWDLFAGRQIGQRAAAVAGTTDRGFSPQAEFVLVTDLGFSPQGRFAFVRTDRTFVVYPRDLSAAPLALKLSDTPVGEVAFAPDDARLAAIGPDGAATICRLPDGQIERVLRADGEAACAVAWSPDGRLIATGHRNQTTRIWQAASGQVVRKFDGYVSEVAFSGDSTLVGTADAQVTYNPLIAPKMFSVRRLDTGDKTFFLQDVPMWERYPPFSPEWQKPDHYPGLAFAADGSAVWWRRHHDDHVTFIRNLNTGEPVLALYGHVECAALAPGPSLVAAGMRNSSVRLWRPGPTHDPIVIETGKGTVIGGAFSPDGTLLLTVTERIYRGQQHTLRLWDMNRPGTPLAKIPLIGWSGAFRRAAFSADGRRIVATSSDAVHVLDAETGRECLTLPAGSTVTAAISPDGARIVTGDGDGNVAVWDARTGRQLHARRTHVDTIWNVTFSPDGRRIVSESYETVIIADAATGEPLVNSLTVGMPLRSSDIDWAGREAWSVAFSSDGARVIARTGEAVATVHNAATGRVVATFAGHTGPIQSVAISPDGLLAATTSRDDTARLWDAAMGRQRTSLNVTADLVRFADFLPGGAWLLVRAESDAWLVRIDRPEALPISIEREAADLLAFSSDGRRVVVPGDRGYALCCDVERNAEMLTLSGHDGNVVWAAFSPDGKHLVTGDSEGRAVVRRAFDWHLARPELEAAKRRTFLHRAVPSGTNPEK